MTKETIKNTQRPDGDIFGEARVALDRCLTIPPTIHVHVHGGTLILTGTVRLPSERSDAEGAVRGIEGVRDLVNRIAVDKIASEEGFEAPEP